jgi:hypothetical protein
MADVNLAATDGLVEETISGVSMGNLYPADIKDFSQA